jgi:hypothetical protein
MPLVEQAIQLLGGLADLDQQQIGRTRHHARPTPLMAPTLLASHGRPGASRTPIERGAIVRMEGYAMSRMTGRENLESGPEWTRVGESARPLHPIAVSGNLGPSAGSGRPVARGNPRDRIDRHHPTAKRDIGIIIGRFITLHIMQSRDQRGESLGRCVRGDRQI